MNNQQIIDTCNYVLDNYNSQNPYLYRTAYQIKTYTKRKIWNGNGSAYLGRKHEIDAFVARVIASTQQLTLNGS